MNKLTSAYLSSLKPCQGNRQDGNYIQTFLEIFSNVLCKRVLPMKKTYQKNCYELKHFSSIFRGTL